MDITAIEAAEAKAKRFKIWICIGLAVLALALYSIFQPHSCKGPIVTLNKNLTSATSADSSNTAAINKLQSSAKTFENKVVTRTAAIAPLVADRKKLKKESDSATVTINNLAKNLTPADQDTIRRALASKDSLIHNQGIQIRTLKRDTADLDSALALKDSAIVVCKAGKAANLKADSTATKIGIKGIQDAQAESGSSFKRGVAVGAVAVALAWGFVAWVTH